jgi:hypothetical protein
MGATNLLRAPQAGGPPSSYRLQVDRAVPAAREGCVGHARELPACRGDVDAPLDPYGARNARGVQPLLECCDALLPGSVER